MAQNNSNKLLRIAVTGPESTGKTELAQQLAVHYKTKFIPEYARTYVEKLKRPYNYLDILHIAHKQVELDKEYSTKCDKYLFYDTEMIITKVWLEIVYGHCPKWVDAAIKQSNIDFYLLCQLDIPWVEDNVRENGGAMRRKLFHIYEQHIIANGFRYKVIDGKGQLRLTNAIAAIEELIANRYRY